VHTKYTYNKASNIIFDFLKYTEKERNCTDFDTLSTWAPGKVLQLFALILDAAGVIYATNRDLKYLNIGDIKEIGKRADIQGILLSNNDEQISDLMCSILFQGWVKQKSHTSFVDRELVRALPNEKGEVKTDFLVLGADSSPTLVECKRIHPAKNNKPNMDNLSYLIQRKVRETIKKAEQQLQTSEKPLNEKFSNRCTLHKLLILDIASYGENIDIMLDKMRIVGLRKDIVVDSISRRM
jgi:hypothetical protein